MSSLPQTAEQVALELLGLAVVDAATFRYRSANALYCKLLGRSEEALSPFTPIDLTYPEDRALTQESLESLKSGRVNSTNGERRYVRADGSFVWFSVLSTALRDASGKVYAIAAVAQDITARRATDDQLRFQAYLLDHVHQAAIATDPQGRVVYWNRAAEHLYGWTRDEALSTSIMDLTVTPEAREKAQEIMSAIRAGKSWTGEFDVRARDGRVFPAQVNDIPVFDAEGRLEAVLGISSDITEQRRTLDTLREADRRKDEFLATLAHELRNPLAPIRNAAEILRVAENDRAAISTARRMIERQLQQMVRLIDDLLDVSRITRGHVELRQERVALSTVLQLAIETSRPLIESRQHVLKLEGPAETFYLTGDPTRLAQVFANLLNNSAKYSESGGRIVIRVERREQQIAVTVADKGIGIEPEMLPRVFEMFTQAGRPESHPQEGLGIGLTLVRRLVELHGGTVTARSDGIGHGSEFVVVLNLAEPPDETDAAPKLRAARASNEEDQRDGLRILVADDNRDAAASLAMMLDLGGHEIRTAHDGIEALTVADQFLPEVVLLDIGMPRLDGYATARELRSRPWAHDLMLVALTGWGQDEDRRRTAEAGFDKHLVKPVDPEVLERMLHECMKNQAST